MALQFYTGFDYYNQTQTGRFWDYFQGGNALIPGRFGGQGWVFNNEVAYLSKLIPNASTVTVGMAFQVAYGDATNPILIFQDATASRTSPITQTDVRVTTDGAFQVTQNGSVLGVTGSYLLEFGTWNYLEVQSFINSSSGAIILRLNGQTFLSVTGNTQTSGNNYVNMVRFQPFEASGSYQMKLDDIYIVDSTGSSPQNTFLGECRVQTQWPTANGETDNFTPIGASTNYQCVNQTISDDDTTYVRAGSAGNIDDYIMGTIALTGAIFGVQVNLTYRKDDVGTRSIAPLIKSSGTYYLGTTENCQSTYAVAQQIWEVEPHSGSAWTNTSVNAIYAGIEVVS